MCSLILKKLFRCLLLLYVLKSPNCHTLPDFVDVCTVYCKDNDYCLYPYIVGVYPEICSLDQHYYRAAISTQRKQWRLAGRHPHIVLLGSCSRVKSRHVMKRNRRPTGKGLHNRKRQLPVHGTCASTITSDCRLVRQHV